MSLVRNVFLTLLFVNLAYFAWSHWIDEPPPPPAQASRRRLPRAPPPWDPLLARSRAAGRREHGSDHGGSLRRRGGLADRRAALSVRVSARGPAGRRGGHAGEGSRDRGLTAAADRRDPHRALKRRPPRPAGPRPGRS